MKKVFFFLLISAALVSCAKKPAQYFPMKLGYVWDYNFNMINGGVSNKMTMKYTINGKGNISGNEYFKFEGEFGGAPGMNKSVDYYRLAPAGVVMTNGDTTRADELIIIPTDVKAGVEWDADNAAGKRHYKLASFEDVAIGDKTYKDCIKIDYQNVAQGQGPSETGYFYFAKDIGLVKLHIDRQMPGGGVSSTEATLAKFSE